MRAESILSRPSAKFMYVKETRLQVTLKKNSLIMICHYKIVQQDNVYMKILVNFSMLNLIFTSYSISLAMFITYVLAVAILFFIFLFLLDRLYSSRFIMFNVLLQLASSNRVFNSILELPIVIHVMTT